MRTVTFADEKLVGLLNASLISVWHNQAPDARNNPVPENPEAAQPSAADAAAYPVGGGGGNMRAYFCTPDGLVLHYLEGYWPAAEFGAEVRTALKRYEELKKSGGELLRNSIQEQLAAQIEAIEQKRAALQREQPAEFTKPVAQSAVRKEDAALGLKAKSYRDGQQIAGQGIAVILQQLLLQNVQKGEII